MAKKSEEEKTVAETVTTEKSGGYVVADGYAFTNKGILYKPGDAISADAFAQKADFDAAVKAGKIAKGTSK